MVDSASSFITPLKTHSVMEAEPKEEAVNPSLAELRKCSQPYTTGRNSDVVRRDVFPDVKELFNYWKNEIYES